MRMYGLQSRARQGGRAAIREQTRRHQRPIPVDVLRHALPGAIPWYKNAPRVGGSLLDLGINLGAEINCGQATTTDASCGIRRGRNATGVSSIARQTFRVTGDRKRERNSRTIIWRRPQTAIMTLDNRPADRQSDSHAFILRSVEGFEKLARSLRLEADSNITHTEAHPIMIIGISIIWLSSNQQISRTIFDGAHGIRSIAKQVQNDLLELDAIAGDEREVRGKFRPQGHAIFLKLTQCQRDYLSCSFIQVHCLGGGRILAVEC